MGLAMNPASSTVPVHFPGTAARFTLGTSSRCKTHTFSSPIIHVLSFDDQLVLDARDDYRLSGNARRLAWLL